MQGKHFCVCNYCYNNACISLDCKKYQTNWAFSEPNVSQMNATMWASWVRIPGNAWTDKIWMIFHPVLFYIVLPCMTIFFNPLVFSHFCSFQISFCKFKNRYFMGMVRNSLTFIAVTMTKKKSWTWIKKVKWSLKTIVTLVLFVVKNDRHEKWMGNTQKYRDVFVCTIYKSATMQKKVHGTEGVTILPENTAQWQRNTQHLIYMAVSSVIHHGITDDFLYFFPQGGTNLPQF